MTEAKRALASTGRGEIVRGEHIPAGRRHDFPRCPAEKTQRARLAEQPTLVYSAMASHGGTASE